MPKVTFMNELKTVEVPAGATLLEAAEQNGIDIFRGIWPSFHCGVFPFVSKGSCNRCKLWVTPLVPGAINERTSKEKSRLRMFNGSMPLTGNMRLACQVKLTGDCEVRTRVGGPEHTPDTVWNADPRPSKWKDRWTAAKAAGGGGDEEEAADETEA